MTWFYGEMQYLYYLTWIIKKLQNKVVGIVTNVKWDEQSTPLYQNLKILSLSKLLNFEIYKFMQSTAKYSNDGINH